MARGVIGALFFWSARRNGRAARETEAAMNKHNPELTSNAKALRKAMTKEENRLWYQFLRGYPVRFYRQKVLGRYIVDFYCAKARLVVELDGSQHFEADGLARDAARDRFLRDYGLTVLHFPNNDVNERFRAVCEAIDLAVKERIS